ncbi:MAG: hypothetical protein V9G14_04285 [Cypionkella sp.]
MVATTENSDYAVIEHRAKRRYLGLQFHPEVVHTPARPRDHRELRPPGVRVRHGTGRCATTSTRRSRRSARRWARSG